MRSIFFPSALHPSNPLFHPSPLPTPAPKAITPTPELRCPPFAPIPPFLAPLAPRISTTSSDEVEVRISEAFQVIGSPHIGGLDASSPVLSWQGEPRSTRSLHGSRIRWRTTPTQRFPSVPLCKRSLQQRTTFSTLATHRYLSHWMEKGNGSPLLASHDYSSMMSWTDGMARAVCAPEGSLGGYGDGDEESWICHYVGPT